ncbi:MAG: tRNA dihydrouridine synthase DusB [Patescibacteria group bacterium]
MNDFSWKTIKKPIIALSPMADMTDQPFCRIVKSLADPIVFREMISSEAIVRGNEKTLGMVDIHDEERPLIQQIFGADPEVMAQAAQIITQHRQPPLAPPWKGGESALRPEGIDINMGCPVYKLTHNFNGAALMKDPDLASKIVASVKQAVDVPVSVKIRAGWSKHDECIEFSKVLEDAGADLITVHGRTKTQGYSGKADWDVIRQVKESVSIPVLVNGNIFSAQDAVRALEQTGCEGVMIARGALGNPWVFEQIDLSLRGGAKRRRSNLLKKIASLPLVARNDIAMQERVRVVKQHCNLHCEYYGEHGIVTFRKHLTWYFKGMHGAKKYRERLHQVESQHDLYKILDEMI